MENENKQPLCKDCGNPFDKTSSEQKFCLECSHERLGADLTDNENKQGHSGEDAIKRLTSNGSVSPNPWRVEDWGIDGVFIVDPSQYRVCAVNGHGKFGDDRANATHIVSCVNFCEGLTNEEITAGGKSVEPKAKLWKGKIDRLSKELCAAQQSLESKDAELKAAREEIERLKASKQFWQDGRKQGRSEAFSLIIHTCAETFADDYIRVGTCGDSGETSWNWDTQKLTELFEVSDLDSVIERFEGSFWEAMALRDCVKDAESRAEKAEQRVRELETDRT